MEITVTIDDALYAEALEFAELDEPSEIIKEALMTYVRIEAARRLGDLDGGATDMPSVPRNREDPTT